MRRAHVKASGLVGPQRFLVLGFLLLGVVAVALTGVALPASVFADDVPPVGGAAAPVSQGPTPSRVIALDAAAKQGLIEVRGERPGGYASVEVIVKSRALEPIRVDLAGRHLTPRTGDAQRLGLAFPERVLTRAPGPASGTYVIELAPGETKSVRMNSCCMDSGKRCPRISDVYGVPEAATPPKVEAALRWWVDHPNAPQNLVNAAIWQSDLSVLDSRAAESAAQRLETRVKSVRSRGGIAYLIEDGALTSLDPEGIRRFHATGIESAWPTGEGLLAVGVGAGGMELWRFGETGDPPWVKVLPLGSTRLEALVPGPGGGYFMRRSDTTSRAVGVVSFRSPTTHEESLVELARNGGADPVSIDLGALEGAKGKAIAIVRRKSTPPPGNFSQSPVQAHSATMDVFDLDSKTGHSALRKTFWNTVDGAVGPAGVFALSFSGKLMRLEGEKFRDVPGDPRGNRIYAVGADRVLVVQTDGSVFSVAASTGKALALPAGAMAAASDRSLSVDPLTDQVVWVEGDAAKRWTPGKDGFETLSFR